MRSRPPGGRDGHAAPPSGARRMAHGAVAGAVAAACWLAVEPAIARLTRPGSYGEARLLGRLVRPHGRWRLVGNVLHIANGALFGTAFGAAGGHGAGRGLAVAQVESALLWPAFVVVDRLHPDRRSGAWPSLVRDRRVFAHEALGHVVFGVVLGTLLRRNRRT